MADIYPYIFEIFTAISHDDASTVGPGCDDQFEFEFALDLIDRRPREAQGRDLTRASLLERSGRRASPDVPVYLQLNINTPERGNTTSTSSPCPRTSASRVDTLARHAEVVRGTDVFVGQLDLGH